MNARDIKEKYLSFFEKHNHKRIQSSSLVPENDPTVLFNTAGMQPLVPFLMGADHPLGRRLVNAQKCVRTGDIEEVGDASHLTFFEMLGNWSLGDYFKDESIELSYKFLTEELNIDPKLLAVSVFIGDDDAPFDQESHDKWISLGIARERIARLPKKQNWWGPAGETGPCGPDTEIFYWTGNPDEVPASFNDDHEFWVEIWNNVFMEYDKQKSTLLLDGMHTLYDADFNVNKELLDAVVGLGIPVYLTVNGKHANAKELLKDTPIIVYEQEEGLKKENKQFFTDFFEKYTVVPSECIYLDHNDSNISGAKAAGLKTIQKFISTEKAIEFIAENRFSFKPLSQKNVDTGMGYERISMVLQGKDNVYETDLFKPLMNVISQYTKDDLRATRILADHIRTAVFMLGDERPTTPSNVDQGYVLRKIIRRSVRQLFLHEVQDITSVMQEVAKVVIHNHREDYPELGKQEGFILAELAKETEKFSTTIEKGLRLIQKKMQSEAITFAGTKPTSQEEVQNALSKFKETETEFSVSGKWLFDLFQSQGLPPEITLEEIESTYACMVINKALAMDEFEQLFLEHQEKSRAGAEQKFKGGLADGGEATTKLHTATHLLNEALRKVVDPDIKQRGSNITAERLRFDFNFDRKLTDEEIKAVEDEVNAQINAGLEVTKKKMSLDEALSSGAQAEFGQKYPDEVWVYSIGEYSKELCGGPHVQNTKEMGTFKIKKEQSSAAGIRRIKAVLE